LVAQVAQSSSSGRPGKAHLCSRKLKSCENARLELWAVTADGSSSRYASVSGILIFTVPATVLDTWPYMSGIAGIPSSYSQFREARFRSIQSAEDRRGLAFVEIKGENDPIHFLLGFSTRAVFNSLSYFQNHGQNQRTLRSLLVEESLQIHADLLLDHAPVRLLLGV
jgi:hypothetical protein